MRKLIVLGLSAVLFAGCAEKQETPIQDPRSQTQVPPSKPDSKAGATLLDFTAPKLGGGQVAGNEFVGRDVAIWFWAPW